jgi:hypothetical protein
MRREIERFFVSYNEAEGRTFRVIAWRGAREARALLARAATPGRAPSPARAAPSRARKKRRRG